MGTPPENASTARFAAPSAPAGLGGFWALIAVQFQNAFSDNALKWLVSFLVLEAALSQATARSLVRPRRSAALRRSLSPLLHSRRLFRRQVQQAQRHPLVPSSSSSCVMGLATFAFARNRLDLAGLALFLACTQGALFGPTKYAPAPRTPARIQIELGQRHHRAHHASLRHLRRSRRRISRHPFPRPPSLVRRLLPRAHRPRPAHQPPQSPPAPAADPTRRFDWNVPREFFAEISPHPARHHPLVRRLSPTPSSGSWVPCCSSTSFSTPPTFCASTKPTAAICSPRSAWALELAASSPATHPPARSSTAWCCPAWRESSRWQPYSRGRA